MDECRDLPANEAVTGEGGGMREMLWLCEKLGVNNALGSELDGGAAI